MLPAIDKLSLFFGAITLAILSIYTILKCREDSLDHLRDPELFLFLGKTREYSLASNLGAVFSATYFFGATFIYGLIFRGTFLVITTLIFIILFWLIPKIINAALPESSHASDQRGNVLLDFLSARLGPQDFKRVVQIYSIIYFLLLIEEISVSRLILHTLFPAQDLIAVALLVTIFFVILAYVYFGGFRAILISDFEQLKVLVPFLLLLVFLMFKDSPPRHNAILLSFPHLNNISGLLFATLFGIAWFSAGVDFYSRLNFTLPKGEDILTVKKVFVRLSLAAIYVLLVAGIVFGEHLVTVMPRVQSPSAYTQAAMNYFLVHSSRIVIVIFFLALFCMLFTTINTLLITLLQAGHYSKSRLLRREVLVRLFLAASVLSCSIPFDAVSAVGVFFGSLLIVPFVSILHALSYRSRLFPRNLSYLLWALPVSAVAFGFFFPHLELSFERHFQIPGIVATATLTTLLLQKLFEQRRGRRHAEDAHGR
jgi:hypothetical protein